MSMTYKGYIGTVEYDDDDEVLHGKIANIRSLVTYEGESAKALKRAFQEAVDDYVSFCRRHGREAEKLLTVAAREGRSLNAVVRASIEEYVGTHS